MAEELVLHASLRDELTAPLARVRGEVAAVSREATRVAAATNASSQSFTRMETASKRLHVSMGSLDTRLRSMSSTIGGALVTGIKRGVTAFGLLTAVVVGFGIKAASNFQLARNSFETLLGSAEKGNALFKELQTLNFKTPFELKELDSSAQQLLRFGVAGGQVVPLLKSIGDIAATSDQPAEALQRLSLAMGQVISKGTLMGQDARQLQEAGFDPYTVLANRLGKTRSEVLQLGAAGKLSSADLVSSLISESDGLERFRGGAAKANQTLFGQFSNLKDQLAVDLAGAAQPLVAQLTANMPMITALVSGLVSKIGPPMFTLVGKLGNLLLKFFPILEPIITAVANGFGQLLDAAGPAVDALAPLGGKIGESLGRFFTALVPLMPKLIELLGKLLELLPKILDNLIHLMPLFEGVIDFMTAVLSNSAATSVIAGLLTALLGYRMLGGVIGTLMGFANALGLIARNGRLAAGVPGPGGVGAGGLARGAAGVGGALIVANGLPGAIEGQSFADDALFVGGAAGLGFSLGGPVGAAAGGALGLGFVGARRLSEFFGDVSSSRVRANMSGVNALAAGAGGGLVTSRLRSFGTRGPDSGHHSGTALDIIPNNPNTYAASVQRLGGFAAREGGHFHTELIGDALVPGGGTSVSYSVSFPGAVFHADVDVERAIARGIAKAEKERLRRGHQPQS